jgi:hypothetical protein
MRTITNNRNLAILVMASLAVAAQASDTVYSNNGGSGDNYGNAGSTALVTPITGYTGSNGEKFEYRETDNGGAAGINTNFARSGNGSAWIDANGTGSKAEIAVSTSFDSQGNTTGALGSFDSLSAWSADLYTASSTIANEAPIMRLELFSSKDGASSSYGQLVFDTAWTPGHFGTFTYGQWTSEDFFANASNIWLRATSGINARYNPGTSTNGERTLADWISILDGKGYSVLSTNGGIGTIAGAGQYEGAIDNIGLGFGGANKVYNFEAVPEPTTMAALGLGIVAVIRRRKKA